MRRGRARAAAQARGAAMDAEPARRRRLGKLAWAWSTSSGSSCSPGLRGTVPPVGGAHEIRRVDPRRPEGAQLRCRRAPLRVETLTGGPPPDHEGDGQRSGGAGLPRRCARRRRW